MVHTVPTASLADILATVFWATHSPPRICPSRRRWPIGQSLSGNRCASYIVCPPAANSSDRDRCRRTRPTSVDLGGTRCAIVDRRRPPSAAGRTGWSGRANSRSQHRRQSSPGRGTDWALIVMIRIELRTTHRPPSSADRRTCRRRRPPWTGVWLLRMGSLRPTRHNCPVHRRTWRSPRSTKVSGHFHLFVQ